MRALPYDFDVVTRLVNQRASSLQQIVGRMPPGEGHLRFHRPFIAAIDAGCPSWHATGRLYGSGLRLARYTRVNIELTAWSDHATELRVRPVTRRLPTWGKRRQRRYFQLAHRTADDLVRSLESAVHRHDALVSVGRPMTIAVPSHQRIIPFV
jgi:hypothetical protein